MHDEMLERLPLFQKLTPLTRQGLQSIIRPVHLARGEVLFDDGDEATDVFILVDGKVKLTKPSRTVPGTTGRRVRADATARESLLSLVGPGELFGELSVMDGGRRSSTATAMLQSRLWQLPAAELRQLMSTSHDLSLAMVQQLAHRLRSSNDMISGLVLSDVPGRLAYVLLGLSDRFGTMTERGLEVHHDLTQAELAQMVGASRETVNKVLTDFVNRRWIQLASGRTIIVLDPSKLRARID